MLEGKFVATRNDYDNEEAWFTKGKVYEFVGGSIIFDNGFVDNFESITHFEDVNPTWEGILTPYNPQPKDLLQMGVIAKLKNGKMGFVLKENIIYKTSLTALEAFNNDLTCNTPHCHIWDISEIYESTQHSCFESNGDISHLGKLLWKREEKTPQQIELEEIEKKQRELAEEQKKLADRIAQINNIK